MHSAVAATVLRAICDRSVACTDTTGTHQPRARALVNKRNKKQVFVTFLIFALDIWPFGSGIITRGTQILDPYQNRFGASATIGRL